MKYLVDRLKEPSSWRGLVLVATSMGISVNPDLVGPIVAAGSGLAGLIGFLTKDKQ